MSESAPISTSSTGGEEIPTELISQHQKISISQSPYPGNYLSKRFKNLIECFPCTVDDCQILFETQKELDIHKATHEKLYKCKYPGCEKTFIKSINLRKNPISKIKKFIFALMKAAIKVSPLLIVSLCIIGFIQGINHSNAKFVEKNFLIKQIGNIM